ncbi:MAG TPA: HAD family hydrolase [Ktedonobacteraceae bacterium]|nr:HAD family hydrolase [Ktedonobacteraceae bacterium]
MIQALIFDFDGLILDTEVSALRSWQEIYQEYNHELPLDQWVLRIGASAEMFDPCAHLASLVGQPVPCAEIEARRSQRHLDLIAQEVALPGIETMIAAAQRQALKVGLASSSPRSWVLRHLSRLGLHAHFDTIKCRDDVTRLKPYPDLYLAALEALEVRAEQAIALEDSPNGVTAAQRAGIFCVAVPNEVTGRLPLDHADLRLASLADLSLPQLIALVEERQQGRTEQIVQP